SELRDRVVVLAVFFGWVGVSACRVVARVLTPLIPLHGLGGFLAGFRFWLSVAFAALLLAL
ncbi:hypothetical protein, partial [Pseudomonas syringae group genomosp. 7]